MLIIYKYPFEISRNIIIAMPKAARVIRVDKQGSVPCMWAIVNPGNAIEQRQFVIYGTGQKIDSKITQHYIGTFFDGPFVWHVFQREDS